MSTGETWRGETVSSQICQMYQDFADRPALLHGDRWLSFSDVEKYAARVASFLDEKGVNPGDRVVLYLQNSAVLRIIELAALRYGRVRVALSPRLHPREVAAIVDDASALAVFCSAERLTDLRRAFAERGVTAGLVPINDSDAVDSAGMGLDDFTGDGPAPVTVVPDDLAMLMYSSGTTGEPKGATVTHRAWVAQTALALAHLPSVSSSDVVLAVAPMTHFGGSIGLDCMTRGAATVPMRVFEPAAVLEAIERHSVTILPFAPIMVSRLAHYVRLTALQAPQLRAIPYGGSPIAESDLLLASRAFPGSLVQFYGLAEALAPISVLTADEHDLAAATDDHVERLRLLTSAGTIVPQVSSRITASELEVRGETVTAAYWNRPDLNRAVLGDDGWFSTGDLVDVDEAGHLHILGRRSEVIISGGFNVHAGEVERIVGAVEGVREVAVFGIPHPSWGAGVAAAIVPTEPVSVEFELAPERLLAAIRTACTDNLAGYKKPTLVRQVSAIPRNSADKIDRNTLQQRFAEKQESEHASS